MISYMEVVDDLPTAYVFGDVCVDRHNFRVRKNGQPSTIEPRAFEVLIYLIEHRGRVVEKEELFEQVWKQTFVTDSALAQEIKNIRHALGDDAASPRYIETIRKHGYRFVAEVKEVDPARAGSLRGFGGATAKDDRTGSSAGAEDPWLSWNDLYPAGKV